MNGKEITNLVAEIAKSRFASSHWQPSPPELAGGGFILEPEGAYCLIRASDTSNPFIWMKAGVALDIPRNDALAYFVATANKDLVVGRAYLAYGDQVAMVVLDETVFAAALAWEHQPSMVDLVTRLDNLLTEARAMQLKILERFGGRPFASDDWSFLIF